MQSANLKEKVGSGIFDAKNALQSKDAVKRIFAYVESYEDIPFWRTVLHGYQTATIKFEIITPTKKGKEQALAMRHPHAHWSVPLSTWRPDGHVPASIWPAREYKARERIVAASKIRSCQSCAGFTFFAALSARAGGVLLRGVTSSH